MTETPLAPSLNGSIWRRGVSWDWCKRNIIDIAHACLGLLPRELELSVLRGGYYTWPQLTTCALAHARLCD